MVGASDTGQNGPESVAAGGYFLFVVLSGGVAGGWAVCGHWFWGGAVYYVGKCRPVPSPESGLEGIGSGD